MDLNKLCRIVYNNSREKGFWDEHDSTLEKMTLHPELFTDKEIKSVGEAEIAKQLALVMSEIGEALEARRIGKTANREGYERSIEMLPETVPGFTASFKDYIKDSFEDELADGILRLCMLAGRLGIDLDWHVEQKARFNQTREKMHGNKIY